MGIEVDSELKPVIERRFQRFIPLIVPKSYQTCLFFSTEVILSCNILIVNKILKSDRSTVPEEVLVLLLCISL